MKTKAWWARWSTPALALAAVLLMFGGSTAAFGVQKTDAPREGYVLRQGDEVAITVLPRSEYDCTGAISPDGMLYLKRIGSVRAAGYTVPELTRQLESALSTILRKPRVTVTLVKVGVPPAPVVSISGAVANPGSYELRPGASLDDAILAAGKLLLVADVERVQLRRGGREKQVLNLVQLQEKGVNGRVVLESGDEIHIPNLGNVVMLIGKVAAPGPRPLRGGNTLHEFFTQGQPETQSALDASVVDLGKVQVIRPGEAARKIDLKAVLKNPRHRDNVVLKAGDVVFLPARVERQKRTVFDYLRLLPFFGNLAGLFP